MGEITRDQQLLLTLIQEHTDELRSRREAEHIYTGAAVGVFIAVTIGVATVQPTDCRHFLYVSWAALLGILIMAGSVTAKVLVEHQKYDGLMGELKEIAENVKRHFPSGDTLLPHGFTRGHAGTGYWWSLGVLWAAAVAAAAMTVSIVAARVR